jgi:phenylacetic acid degradation operon negative regulatory protein
VFGVPLDHCPAGRGQIEAFAREVVAADKAGAFVAVFPAAAGPDPLARVIELVHAWCRFPWLDPGLPARFLPSPWIGSHAAELFARLHAQWADEAISQWKQLLD